MPIIDEADGMTDAKLTDLLRVAEPKLAVGSPLPITFSMPPLLCSMPLATFRLQGIAHRADGCSSSWFIVVV